MPRLRDDGTVASPGAYGHPGRLLLYIAGATAGSVVGAMFTWNSSVWSGVNPLVLGPWEALFSLGPAMLIAAKAPLSGRVAGGFALCCASAMLVMWFLFVSSESSTSALVFLMGWVFGIPIASVLVWATRRTEVSRA